MTIRKILVADDEAILRNFLKEVLTRQNKQVVIVENGLAACQYLEKQAFDLVITDMKMPLKTGLDVLEFAKKMDSRLPVILMTAFASVENAVEAMQKGAFHYLIKPFSCEAIETMLKKAEEHIALLHENDALKAEISTTKNKHSFITASLSMQKLLKNIKKIAKSHASVFVFGESGTGKEVIARAIHELSTRANSPFITVNCAAVSESLIESEFFGHEKGSFTGAHQKRRGRFEMADCGTLLLDEVTEIPIALQAKLLRAIQEQEFERVGGSFPIKVNVRFISTSNRDMQEAIQNKIFREDLYYRLNVIPLHIPSLRDRKEDILPLAQSFLEKFCKQNHKKKKFFTKKAEAKLLDYSWPGNVRELGNIIERTVVIDHDEQIDEDDLYLDMDRYEHIKSEKHEIKTLKEIEKIAILSTLKKENNNKSKAAKLLGITPRTLRNKLKEYQLIGK